METKKTSKLNLITTIVLLVICVFLAFLIGKTYLGKKNTAGNEPMKAQTSSTIINVSTASLKPTTFIKETVIGADIVNTMDSVSLYSSDVAGKITKLDLAVGQNVTAGDAIAVVDPSTAGAQYKPSTVKASIGGKVESVDCYVGQSVSTTTSLATLVNAGELEIKATMAERYLSSVKVGMKASFTTSAWPEESFTATVKEISPTINKSNRTFTITLSIDKMDERLKEGMYVKLSLIVEQQDQVITVPTKSIGTYLGGSVVYLAVDGKAKRVSVTVGSANGSETVIKTGLAEGDELITAGSVTDGSQISIVKE